MTEPADGTLDALRDALGAQYDILRRLGQGGMGSVYLARDRTLDRDVAIKVINAEVASNAALRERFLAEARAVAKLRHPGIVAVYAAGEARGILYFAMEFVPGESLRDRLAREQRLPPAEAERIVREIALALDHAHTAGLVHRDVKPENILLDAASGRAMLTDFGVARALEADGNLTGTGMILGSPRYMSPEQASGDRALDGRSDLYALALIGYECLSGAPVVQATSASAMLIKHLTETPAPLASVAGDVPAPLALAIERGLAKDPDQRWQTGREFAEALGHAMPSTGQWPAAAAPRKAVPKVALAGAAVAIGASLVAVLLSRRDRGDATAGDRYVVAPFEIQSGDPSVSWLREGAVNMLTLSLGQWSDLQVIDYERTLGLLDAESLAEKPRLSLDDARKLARRGDAGRVLTGQVLTTPDSLRVVARLYDVRSGDALEQAEEAGRLGDDPRPVFDRLARRLLNVAGGPASTVELMQATTSNLAAYRSYLSGVRLLQAWQLNEADSAFADAIARDSSFALAYHKRALALGWSQTTLPEYVGSAQRAFDLADRLPPREKALVQGHYYLVRGLSAGFGVVQPGDSALFEQASTIYADLLARDSLVAEAWYGWADAAFHGRTITDVALIKRRTDDALRGFHRTLAIDSAFHLAYSHLVQLYNAAASLNQGPLIQGDTAVLLATPEDLQRFGGLPAVQRAIAEARARGLAIARAWARSDRQSAQPLLQLAQSFAQADQPDSAVAVLRAADLRGAEQRASIAVELTKYLLSTADTALGTHVQRVVDGVPVEVMARLPVIVRVQGLGALAAGAAMAGRESLLSRVISQYASSTQVMPEIGQLLAGSAPVLRVAMGAPATPAFRQGMQATVAAVDAMPPGMAAQARGGSLSAVYFAYLATHDTTFATTLRRWSGPDRSYPELDATAALDRGDTAAAQAIARTFPAADSLRTARFTLAGMRVVARAEVLARLGLTRQAAEMLEVVELRRATPGGFVEPGYAVWVRSLADRARLWARLGERDRAVAAYERFLAHWPKADGVSAPLVAAAKRELAELEDR